MATEDNTRAIEKALDDAETFGQHIDAAEKAITEVNEKCNPAALAAMGALRQSVVLARGVQLLRKALNDKLMDQVIMPLQNSKLGFLTDRANAKNGPTVYSRDEVREVMIEAILRGLHHVNNEINIISGGCYAAKNGVERLCKTYPGVSQLVLTPGIPEMAPNNTALIAMRATWTQDGNRQEYYRGKVADKDGVVDDTRFAVRVNGGMGPDAIIGKAERKMYAAIYSRLTNGAVQIPDGDAIDTVGVAVASGPTPAPAEPSQDGKRIKIGGNGKGAPPERKSEPAAAPARESGEGE